MKKIILTFLVIVLAMMSLSCDSSADHIGEAKTPSGSSVQKGRMLEDVIKDFEDHGFKNIVLEKEEDLITGWLTKDGEVESVSVDADKDYLPDKWYPEQVEVIITYHTFPSDDDIAVEDADADNTPSEDEIEIASYVEERTQKNDFEASKNINIEFKGFSIQVPKYFIDEKVDDGYYHSYAQKGVDITMISIAESYDDADTVSFDLLLDDSDNLFRSITFMYDDAEIINSEIFSVEGTKGLLYQYKFSQDDIKGIGYHYCFPIVKSNKWGYINILNSFDSSYAYDEEFMRIIESIILSSNSASLVKPPILSQAGEVKTEETSAIITSQNNDDFAKLLKTHDYGEMSMFASTYKGRTIQFDGNIAHMMYHEDFRTRYDILIYGGDFSTTSAEGPSFKFEDVNIVSDLKLSGDNIPDYIEAGQNFKFTAEVLYFDKNSGLFFLKPVKTEVR